MTTSSLSLNGESLTIEQVLAVAEGVPGTPVVELAPDAAHKVQRAQQAIAELIAAGEIVYGITTGFGAFKDQIIDPGQVQQLQRNIVMSHAVGVGPPFDRQTVRALMLIRANTLAKGHSGVRLETLRLLMEMLNRQSQRQALLACRALWPVDQGAAAAEADPNQAAVQWHVHGDPGIHEGAAAGAVFQVTAGLWRR